MRAYTKFYITPKGERATRSGHPWVYAEEITNIEGEYVNGDLVDVVTNKGKYLGTGFVNNNSKIRVLRFRPILMINLTPNFGNVACVMLSIIVARLCRVTILNAVV